MNRRHATFQLAALALLAPQAVRSQGLASLSDTEATRGLRAALETGALAAVRLLGAPDGFWANPQVRIPLPGALQDASRLLKALGQGRQIDDLELAMNRAAESAVPMGRKLLVDAVRTLSVQDAKAILTGGDTSVTQFFAGRTREPLSGTFLPVVRQATAKVGLAQKYDRLAGKAAGMGLIQQDDASINHYVTRKALDGLYLVIGEQERQIRRDPVGTGSALLAKVFGALR